MFSIIAPRTLLIRINSLGRYGQEVKTRDVLWMIGVLIGKFLFLFGYYAVVLA